MIVFAILLAPISAIAAQVVNINQADAATMIENWKGIGEKKASAIISYREKNGPFSDINDLANVKGIGEGIIKNNRKLMSVSKGVFKPTGKKQSSSSTSKKTTSSKSKDTKAKDKKSSSKNSTAKKDTSKKSSSKKSTSKKSTDKKSKTKKSKTKKCKPGSTDKNCKTKPTKKKKKKNSTT